MALKHNDVLEPLSVLQQASRPQAAVTEFISSLLSPPSCHLESDSIFTTERAGRKLQEHASKCTRLPANTFSQDDHELSSKQRGHVTGTRWLLLNAFLLSPPSGEFQKSHSRCANNVRAFLNLQL